jgi:periplasmic protein TonB
MPLRCLLFSSKEELVQPIWQGFTDLGIEGEYCPNAVDAVERVTTQLFQIVIIDWEDQPEAAFLLKTARDLKAAHRPLILAIVGEDAKLPEALRAGANSVLVKPVRTEQVRDTMSTACELLRTKFQSAAPQTVAQHPTAQLSGVPREEPGTTALAAAAAAGAASVPASVTQSPEKTFRAGEFLTSAGSAPGAQFDTETECDVQKSLDQAAAAEIDALTELEPMAASVEEAAGVEDAAPEAPEPETPLTGWASLQSRLMKPPRAPVEDAPAKQEKNELLAYGETPSYGTQAAKASAGEKDPVENKSAEESKSEAELFAYMSGELDDGAQPAARPGLTRERALVLIACLAACLVLAAIPQTRRTLQMFYRSAAHAAANWLNPPPAALPQAVAQHDSFGQSGDEYKLPATGNIPDATTDPSQIRVLPVIDPTAKTEKNPDTNGAQSPATTGQNSVSDQKPADQSQPGQDQTQQTQTGQDQFKDSTPTSIFAVPANAPSAPPAAVPAAAQAQTNTPVVRAAAPQPHLVTSAPSNIAIAAPHAVSTASSPGIPSSLKSQMASSTPDASGNKPVEAAMSSIEPVILPESAALELLTQPVDPVYPAAAKASGQRGSVVLQVVIGRDGAVQDVKFLQGSLMFARAAIDAVRQWRFKPYSMNGRAVSVQSQITLNFRPPA